jgi:predicted AAA+ superfamily ATPase
MENKKKRVVVKNIENKRGARFEQYSDEFDYLVSSGIALEVEAISNPKYPLSLSMTKNLLKLYINDVGLFTNILYGNNIRSILDDENSVNLGSVYEDVVASELKAHGFRLFYYDNKKNGEVDFLVEDKDTTSILPLEIKSGKDYSVHSALSRFISTPDYAIKKAYVLSNEREVKTVNGITYLPIYYIMFFAPNKSQADVFLP